MSTLDSPPRGPSDREFVPVGLTEVSTSSALGRSVSGGFRSRRWERVGPTPESWKLYTVRALTPVPRDLRPQSTEKVRVRTVVLNTRITLV